MTVRQPAVAGAFYPSEKEELEKMIKEFLESAEETRIEGTLKALVEPHAGYIYSGPVAAYGYKLLASHQGKMNKVIILGPSHYAAFLGACEAGFDFWETPLGRVNAGSVKIKEIKTYPQAHGPEHCLEVQLPFLQTVMKNDFTVYPLLCGELNPAELANALADQIDSKTLIIASSDLSHYLPYDTARSRDRIANETVPTLDIKRFEGSGDACGKIPILVLMHIAKKKGWKGKLLDYRNSGDTAGPKNQVVGYGCYAFYSD